MRLEPKPAPTLAVTLLYPLGAVAATLVITSLLVLVAGASPFSVFYLVAKGAAGSQFALLETLTRSTPLIFTGLAVAVAFRARLWNIGAEAQLYVGGIVTVVLGTGALPLPAFLLIPIIMVVAMAGGALMLLGPAVLKTRFGVDEVVTTLLLNFIVLLFVSMLLEGPLKDPMGLGWPQSSKVIAGAQLPRIIQGKRLHYGFVIAIVSALIVWVIMKKTTLGYEMRAVGHNPQAAGFAGIPVNRVLMKTALLSGGLAALAGFSEVSGLKGNLTLDLSPGYGYSGIVVAMLAMLNPVGVVVSAIFVAGIFVGADAMSRAAQVPSYIADVMVATALLTMVVAILMTRFRIRWK
ncbi:MAG: ABC transporter permease [Alphaproteobacteria bacterium]|nr:ABC transporter permease [Alphaproteobacteria bacterium]MBU0803666.1 ABC transporter permease [Alphaproteobacteria bacterium]MBU0873037.1 ABC transporter permease [Alphaproteobacteria bacterium]MBU1402593.1 ABC transporter permease [Alphaproteobacteria bacterium]MBU1593235.1 ABC transporter permease [Alphaproteobacteria bacterium]